MPIFGFEQMKIEQMKTLLLLVTLVIFSGCEHHDDPFSSVNLNTVSREQFVSQFLSEGVLVEPDEDSTTFRYVLKGYDAEFPLKVSIEDYYDFGKVRKFKVILGTDQTFPETDKVCRNCGPRSKKDIDVIYEIYKDFYGQPDSLTVKPKYRYENAWLARPGEEPTVLDPSIPPSKRAVWTRNYFDIVFEIGYATKSADGDEFVYGAGYGSEALITYKMKNYEKELKRITDSVRAQLTPNDLFTIYVDNPKWYDVEEGGFDSKCVIQFGSIMRKDREEPKRVKAIRYDIVISDAFNTELLRIKDQTFEFREPIANMSPTGIEMVSMNRVYVARFNSMHPDAEKLQQVRAYDHLNRIFTKVDIRTVLFENGSQLHSKS